MMTRKYYRAKSNPCRRISLALRALTILLLAAIGPISLAGLFSCTSGDSGALSASPKELTNSRVAPQSSSHAGDSSHLASLSDGLIVNLSSTAQAKFAVDRLLESGWIFSHAQWRIGTDADLKAGHLPSTVVVLGIEGEILGNRFVRNSLAQQKLEVPREKES